jgi:hypothetical protein
MNGNASEWLSAVDGLADVHQRLRATLEKQLAANLRRLGRCIAQLEQSAHVSLDGWRMLETIVPQFAESLCDLLERGQKKELAADVLARLRAGGRRYAWGRPGSGKEG